MTHRRDRRKSEGPKDSESALAGARVLVVDDNEINRAIAEAILAGAGCLLYAAADGREAVEKVRASAFDIVLMDLRMPGMDGLEAAKELRAEPRFASLPIIAMGATSDAAGQESCLAAGVSAFVDKPFEREALLGTLSRWYRGRPPAGSPGLEGTASTPRAAPPTAEAQSPAGAAPVAAAPRPVQGLDAASGLARVLGDGGLYRKLLEGYKERHCAAPTSIARALQAGDLELAGRIAHTLKSASGNIGATEVQAAAEAMETAIETAVAARATARSPSAGARPADQGAAGTDRAGCVRGAAALAAAMAATREAIDLALASLASEGPEEPIPPEATGAAELSSRQAPGRSAAHGAPPGPGRTVDEALGELSAYIAEGDCRALDFLEETRGELAGRRGRAAAPYHLRTAPP